MINPMTVMKLLGERKEVVNNHPDFYRYIKTVFGSELPEGTEIEIHVTQPDQKRKSVKMQIEQTDVKFFKMFQELIK